MICQCFALMLFSLEIIIILIWLFWTCLVFLLLFIGMWRFPCVAVVSESFRRLLVIWSCLINRDIWRGIFAALAVVSAGYLNFVCVSSGYLLVSCFSVAYCRAILFLRTGGNLFCEYLLWILSLIFLHFLFRGLLIYNISFLFQLFRLGHRTVWWSCWTGSCCKDEIWWGVRWQFPSWSRCHGSS